jgi:hypothetical protein
MADGGGTSTARRQNQIGHSGFEPARSQDTLPARRGEHFRSRKMLVLGGEQGSAAPGAIERELLDQPEAVTPA